MFHGASEASGADGVEIDDGSLPVASLPTEHLAKLVLEAELATRAQHADHMELLAEANRRGCVKDSIHRSTATWLADEQRARTHTSTKTLHLAQLAFEIMVTTSSASSRPPRRSGR